MRHTATMTLAGLLAAAALLAGCVTPENDRGTIGRSVRLEAFTAAPAQPAGPDMSVPVGQPVPQEPSIRGLDRGHWTSTRIFVPVDGTAHRPTYAKRVHLADATARQRGEYPNAETALELTGDSLSDQQLEALANHGIAALDTLLLLPAMVWQAPWRVRWSPDVAYERTWAALEQRMIEAEQEESDAPLDDPFAAPPPHPVTP